MFTLNFFFPDLLGTIVTDFMMPGIVLAYFSETK